jgi:hypothetical protein
MRHIPSIGLVVLTGVCNLGCSAAPIEPAETQGGSAVARSPLPEPLHSASANAAFIIRNQGCTVADGDGQFISADRDFVIATQSTGLNTTLICTVKHVANSAGRSVKYTTEDNPFGAGASCGLAREEDLFITTDWTQTVSASGNATLRCHFKL